MTEGAKQMTGWIVKVSRREGPTTVEASCQVEGETRQAAHQAAWAELGRVLGLRPQSSFRWKFDSCHSNPDISGGW